MSIVKRNDNCSFTFFMATNLGEKTFIISYDYLSNLISSLQLGQFTELVKHFFLYIYTLNVAKNECPKIP